MGCPRCGGNRRNVTRAVIPSPTVERLPGSEGWTMINYSVDIIGPVTGARYPFSAYSPRWVDINDARLLFGVQND